MNIEFNVNGNRKQLLCVKYWLDNSISEIVYGGSKGCFSAETLVKTSKGLKKINEIKANDLVLTFDEATKEKSYNRVLHKLIIGGAKLKKMIKFEFYNGIEIKCTDNHEFYFNGNWVHAGNLARRILEIRIEHEQQIFNIKQRSFIDNFLEGFRRCKNNDTTRLRGLHENHHYNKREKDKRINSPISCNGFFGESKQQASSKSYRFQPLKQLFGKLGILHKQRKYATFFEGKQIERFSKRLQTEKPEQGRESLERKINGNSSFGNKTEIQKTGLYKGNAIKRIWSKSFNNKRHYFDEKLASFEIDPFEIKSIDFYESTEFVYDLHIEKNHNYCVSENNIIVHNSGKSFLGCSLICGDALIYPETFYFIARKKLNDLRKFTIPSIHEVLNGWNIPKEMYNYNGQDNLFEFTNGSKIFLLDAKYLPSDPTYARFGSMQMTRGWIEEAGEFELEAKNNLSASVGRWNNDKYKINGKVLQTCNPAKNYLYKEYYKKNKENSLEAYKRFIQALPTDNKMIEKGYLEHLGNILSKNEKERLLFGNWEFDDDPSTLCDYENIIAVFENDHIEKGKKYITGDVARQGSDKAVVLVWEGWKIIECFIFEKSKITELQALIQNLRFKHAIGKKEVVIDEDGVGGGLVDSLSSSGFINNSRALNEENYFNLQSQCCYFLADKINKKEIYFEAEISEKHKEEIIEELEQLKSFKSETDGKLRILPKDEIKQRIGRSPDFRDALMMRSYFDIKPKSNAPKSTLIRRR